MNTSKTFIWVLVLLALVIGAVFLLRVGYLPFASSDMPMVSYRVSGTASVSLVTYTQTDGTASEPDFQPLPWTYGPLGFSEPTMVVVTAHNSSQYGYVVCEILRDGKTWKKDKATYPALNASCGGYVR